MNVKFFNLWKDFFDEKNFLYINRRIYLNSDKNKRMVGLNLKKDIKQPYAETKQ